MKISHWWLGLPGILYDLFDGAGSGNNNNTVVTPAKTEENEEDKTAKEKANIYNYYTSDSENGNTLFQSQKKTKRTLFGEG